MNNSPLLDVKKKKIIEKKRSYENIGFEKFLACWSHKAFCKGNQIEISAVTSLAVFVHANQGGSRFDVWRSIAQDLPVSHIFYFQDLVFSYSTRLEPFPSFPLSFSNFTKKTEAELLCVSHSGDAQHKTRNLDGHNQCALTAKVLFVLSTLSLLWKQVV